MATARMSSVKKEPCDPASPGAAPAGSKDAKRRRGASGSGSGASSKRDASGSAKGSGSGGSSKGGDRGSGSGSRGSKANGGGQGIKGSKLAGGSKVAEPQQPAAPRAPRRMLVEVQSTVDFFKDRIKFWARSIERQGIDLELVLTSQLAGRVPFVTVVGNETHAKGTAAAAAAGAGGGVVVTADWVQACVNSGERLGWERFMQRAVEGEAEEVRAAARREEEAAAQKELQRLAATQSGAASSEEMAFAMIMRLLKLQRPYPPRGPRSRMLRAWVGAGGGAAKEGAGGGAARSEGGAGAFRFVTWNILMTESFGGSNGGAKWYLDPKYRLWEHRSGLIKEQLDMMDADVICLQEVSCAREVWHETFRDWADARGYERSPTGTEMRILVRRDRFEVLEFDSVNFHEAFNSQQRQQQEAARGGNRVFIHNPTSGVQPAAPKADLTSIAWRFVSSLPDFMCLAALRCKQTGKIVVAASVHLPNDPNHQGLNVLIMDIVCRDMKAMGERAARKHGRRDGAGGAEGVAYVVGGDFNSHPGPLFDPYLPPSDPRLPSAVYEFMSTGRLGLDNVHHPYNWGLWWTQRLVALGGARGGGGGGGPPRVSASAANDARKADVELCLGPLASAAVAATGSETALTFYGPRLGGTLDYVFFGPQQLRASGWLAMPWETDGNGVAGPDGKPFPVGALKEPEEAMQTVAWLPHENFPSDHIPVGVELQFL